jgi:hypothetical protein
MSLKQVSVTKTKTVSIPASYGKSGATGVSAGSASIGGGSGGAAKKTEAYQRGFALFAGG